MGYYQILIDYLNDLKKIEFDRKQALQVVAAGALGFSIIYLG